MRNACGDTLRLAMRKQATALGLVRRITKRVGPSALLGKRRLRTMIGNLSRG
jgi:hypothetical protein